MGIVAHINLDDEVGVRLTKHGLRVLKLHLEIEPQFYPQTIKEQMDGMKVGEHHIMSLRKLILRFGDCIYPEHQDSPVFEDDEIIWTTGNAIVGVRNGDMLRLR